MDDTEPEETVWSAVADLELKAYTKEEIANVLDSVAAVLRRESE